MAVVTPEQYGAVGNGTTIDTDAFVAMIAGAGVGGIASFTPGKTYVIDGELFPLAGQLFDGRGATIKRAGQAVTTLTAPMTDTTTGNGSTIVLQVASSTNFRINSYLTLTKATPTLGADTNTDTRTHKIVAKTATTITVQAGFSLTFATGDQVVSSYHIFRNTAAGVRWRDIVFDGNRAVWQVKGLRWETITTIRTSGDDCHLSDITLQDLPGEGVQLGGLGSTMIRWRAENIGGNPVHLTAGDDVQVSHFYVDGANRVWFENDAATVGYDVYGVPNSYGTLGHEDGGVAWSLECRRAKVFSGIVKNALAVLSPPNVEANDRQTVVGVDGIDCQIGLKARNTSAASRNISLTNCNFYNCGVVLVQRTVSTVTEATSQVRTQFLNCILENTRYVFIRVYETEVTGGRVMHDGTLPGQAISISSCTRARITGVTINGAQYGVLGEGACQKVDVSGNTITGTTTAAISLSNIDSGAKAIRANNNTIEVTSGSGIFQNEGSEATFNDIDCLASAAGQSAILTANGSYQNFNTLRIANGVYAVRAFGGTNGIIAKNNRATVYAGSWDLSNSFAAGSVNNTFADNYALVTS